MNLCSYTGHFEELITATAIASSKNVDYMRSDRGWSHAITHTLIINFTSNGTRVKFQSIN